MRYIRTSSLGILINIFALYSVWMCINDTSSPKGYEMMWLLPAVFFVFNFFSFNILFQKEISNNLPNIIVIVLMFIRNVITPLVMTRDSYVSSLGIATSVNARNAILLITYESIVIFLFLLLSEKYRVRFRNLKNVYIKRKKIPRTIIYIVLGLMFILGILALVRMPAFRNQFYTLFTNDITHLEREEVIYNGVSGKIIGSGGEICINILRFVFPVLVINRLSKNNCVRNLIISVFLIFLQCLFINDSNAYILMLMFSHILFVAKVFPRYERGLALAAGGVVVAFFILLYINRFALDHFGKSLSLFLQSYIPGIANTAGIYNVKRGNGIFQIFKDFVDALPFRVFLGLSMDIDTTADLWKYANNSYKHILSTVGQGYYYFGPIFAPILSCLMIGVAKRISESLNTQKNPLMYASAMYLMIYSAATPFMYNNCIYFRTLLQRVLFFYLVSLLCKERFVEVGHSENIAEEYVL